MNSAIAMRFKQQKTYNKAAYQIILGKPVPLVNINGHGI